MTNAQKTITELLETYGDTLYQYALLKTANSDVAADFVQDTFEAAIRGLTTFKGKSNIKTWLFGILRNKINDYYRLKYREQPYSENDDSDIEDAVFNEGGY
jgi:RNA polymerase sigma-70 factor (ECF subfamily)